MSFEEYLQNILKNIDDTKVQGIAKKAIDVGFGNLSSAQQSVLNNGISDYIMTKCPNCGDEITYEDMEISIFNGRCPQCQADWDKNYED
ncbi:MAG: hypothetical protein ACQERD_11675 [Campylobacterota bacterium]